MIEIGEDNRQVCSEDLFCEARGNERISETMFTQIRRAVADLDWPLCHDTVEQWSAIVLWRGGIMPSPSLCSRHFLHHFNGHKFLLAGLVPSVTHIMGVRVKYHL